MGGERLQWAYEATFRVCSPKWRLMVYARIKIGDAMAFDRLWYQPFFTGRETLVLRAERRSGWFMAKDGIELLSRRLWIESVARGHSGLQRR